MDFSIPTSHNNPASREEIITSLYIPRNGDYRRYSSKDEIEKEMKSQFHPDDENEYEKLIETRREEYLKAFSEDDRVVDMEEVFASILIFTTVDEMNSLLTTQTWHPYSLFALEKLPFTICVWDYFGGEGIPKNGEDFHFKENFELLFCNKIDVKTLPFPLPALKKKGKKKKKRKEVSELVKEMRRQHLLARCEIHYLMEYFSLHLQEQDEEKGDSETSRQEGKLGQHRDNSKAEEEEEKRKEEGKTGSGKSFYAEREEMNRSLRDYLLNMKAWKRVLSSVRPPHDHYEEVSSPLLEELTSAPYFVAVLPVYVQKIDRFSIITLHYSLSSRNPFQLDKLFLQISDLILFCMGGIVSFPADY